MSLKFRKKLLLAKKEATYGTDPTPDGSSNAIRTSNMTITPLNAETTQRNLDQPNLGSELMTHFGVHVVMEFDVDVAGSGAAGTAPAYGPLLLACGMAETVNAGTDVQYDPVSADEDSVTMYLYIDGQKHAMTGARGAFQMRFQRGFPVFHFVFTGLWVAPAAEADPTPDYSAFQDPVVMSNANSSFSLHGETPNFFTGQFDQANEVTYQDIVGDESVQIVDRSPGGQLTIEAPALGTKNWFTTIKANTTGALQFVQGTVAGNIVQLDCDDAQVLNPRYGDNNGVATLQMELNIIPASGDDDFKITVK